MVDAGRELRVGEAALGMGVHVDESGRNVPAGSVDDALGAILRQVSHGGDRVAHDAYVGFYGVSAGAVEDQPAAYGYLEVHIGSISRGSLSQFAVSRLSQRYEMGVARL